MLHIDFSGGMLKNWTKVATGLPTPAAGFGYHQIAPPDFGGYSAAKIRIVGGILEVRSSLGAFMADTAITYPVIA